jgi:hypothetical protein
MGELASKYGGDVQKALRAVHHQHLQAMNDPAVTESPRKRKYLEEVDGAGMPAESSRASKTGELTLVSSSLLLRTEISNSSYGYCDT